ncbi:MAG: flagellar basal body rod C-terminal domain-containing protein [Candidatus Baltobacteraceae bacterium]
MNEFDVLEAAGSGMEAQRAALDVAARNVAAAEVDGRSFARLVPRFAFDDAGGDDFADGNEGGVVRYLGTTTEPGVVPDAIAEMVSVLDAQRAYEANASVFDAGKRLMERTIDVERI